MSIFTAVKYCCILHGRVFVMKYLFFQFSMNKYVVDAQLNRLDDELNRLDDVILLNTYKIFFREVNRMFSLFVCSEQFHQ